MSIGKRQALDLLNYARLRLLHGDDGGEITVSKRDFADLLALAERAPLRGGANVLDGHDLTQVALTWVRARWRYHDLRGAGEEVDDAIKIVVSEFAPKYPDVFKPFGRPLAFSTLKQRLGSHWSPHQRRHQRDR